MLTQRLSHLCFLFKERLVALTVAFRLPRNLIPQEPRSSFPLTLSGEWCGSQPSHLPFALPEPRFHGSAAPLFLLSPSLSSVTCAPHSTHAVILFQLTALNWHLIFLPLPPGPTRAFLIYVPKNSWSQFWLKYLGMAKQTSFASLHLSTWCERPKGRFSELRCLLGLSHMFLCSIIPAFPSHML